MSKLKIKTEKQLRARSIVLLKTTSKLGADIHAHLMDHVAFIRQTRNVTPLHDFIQSLAMLDGEGNSRSIVRASAVKTWAEAFAFYRTDKDGNPKLASKAMDALDDAAFGKHIAKAATNPWHKFSKDKAWKEFDLVAMIKSLVGRAEEKRLEKVPEGCKPHHIPEEALKALKAIIA